MAYFVTLEEAQARLPQLIDQLLQGTEQVITKDGKPVAKLLPYPLTEWPCEPGTAKDKILFMADDFDAPLEDFRDYME